MDERLPLQVFSLGHELSQDAHLRLGPTVFGRPMSKMMHELLQAHAECLRCRRPATLLVEHSRCRGRGRYAPLIALRIPREHVPAVQAEFALELRRDVYYQASC